MICSWFWSYDIQDYFLWIIVIVMKRCKTARLGKIIWCTRSMMKREITSFIALLLLQFSQIYYLVRSTIWLDLRGRLINSNFSNTILPFLLGSDWLSIKILWCSLGCIKNRTGEPNRNQTKVPETKTRPKPSKYPNNSYIYISKIYWTKPEPNRERSIQLKIT